MILLLDTSTPVCKLSLVDADNRRDVEWEAGRNLAKGLLRFLVDECKEFGRDIKDIDGIVGFKGPGSFTGLRIGLTVLNTLADSNNIPIVGESGDNWQQAGLDRLKSGQNDQIIFPDYGAPANITTPRK